MTTPLIDEVTRRTGLKVDDREVEVTLVPGSIANAMPPSIRFHLVGLHEKSDRAIPLTYILNLAGFKVKLPSSGNERLTPSQELERLFQDPDFLALEKRILGQAS